MDKIVNFIKNLFIRPAPTELSPEGRQVMISLFALENAIKGLPQTEQADSVRAQCKAHHKALDNLRKYHGKTLPPPKELKILGGPGTKEEPKNPTEGGAAIQGGTVTQEDDDDGEG